MSGVADLQSAVAALATAVQTEIAEVQAVIAALQAGALTDAQAEALAQQLQSSVTNLNNETATLQGVAVSGAPPQTQPKQ